MDTEVSIWENEKGLEMYNKVDILNATELYTLFVYLFCSSEIIISNLNFIKKEKKTSLGKDMEQRETY
jgi:hypothetical protein